MRRIAPYISLIALLAAFCLAGPAATCSLAATDTSPSVNKAALDKAVQEALAKGQLGGSAGSQNAAAAGAETPSSSEVFGTPNESASSLTSQVGEEEEVAPTAATTSATSAISTGVVIPVLVICVLLLAGTAFFIMRDARNVAPVGDGLASSSSAQDRATRLRKRRAKAKAARRQRKRNR